MISKTTIEHLAAGTLEEQHLFAVSIDISPSNHIKVVLDGDKGVSIEQCMAVSRAIEHNLDRDKEDFSLEVSSYGLTNPLILTRQYLKNIGKEVKVELLNGSKVKGRLVQADDKRISLEKARSKKEIKAGVEPMFSIDRNAIKETKVEISFK